MIYRDVAHAGPFARVPLYAFVTRNVGSVVQTREWKRVRSAYLRDYPFVGVRIDG